MNPHPMPTPRTRSVRLLLAGFLAFTGAVGLAAANGFSPGMRPNAEPTAAPSESPVSIPASSQAVAERPRIPDVVIARAALTALDSEKELRGVNLIVSVVDRVAVIGGPVGDARQAKRAEEVVRAIPGIAEVRNNCFVSPDMDAFHDAVAGKLGSSLPPRPTFVLPGVITGTPVVSFPLPTDESNLSAMSEGSKTVVARKPSSDHGVLGGPVGPAPPGTRNPTPPPAPTPATLTANRADTQAAIEELRRSEPRFARLTVESRAGVLVIGGAAPLVADAWDYADKLRGVPGVTRVAVGNVQGK